MNEQTPRFWMVTTGASLTGRIHHTLAAAQNDVDWCLQEKTLAGLTYHIIPLVALEAIETKTNEVKV
jgi:hypothetical protein